MDAIEWISLRYSRPKGGKRGMALCSPAIRSPRSVVKILNEKAIVGKDAARSWGQFHRR
jgi:hypothetical protein